MSDDKNLNVSLAAYVGWLLLISAFGFYAYVMVTALVDTVTGEVDAEHYPEYLTSTMASLQALLLTNLGVVLGISVANPSSPVSKALFRSSPGIDLAPPAPMDAKDKIQLVSVIIYLVSLIACTGVWLSQHLENDPHKIVSFIPESAKMFVGVILAYVAAVLSK